VTVQKLATNKQGKIGIPLAATGTARFTDGSQAGGGHQICKLPFPLGQGCRTGEDAASDSGPHGSTTGSMETTESSFDVLSPLAGNCQLFRLAFVSMYGKVCGNQDCRNQEVMFRAMHLNSGIFHQTVSQS
jgi:hypothetical protein